MKLLVDISDEDYKRIKLNMRDSEQEFRVVEAVKDATPITDGDLISRSALRKQIKSYADDQYAENEYLGECAILGFIDNAPTLGDQKNE